MSAERWLILGLVAALLLGVVAMASPDDRVMAMALNLLIFVAVGVLTLTVVVSFG